MYTITLIEPQIPPNTGNIVRLCAATGSKLEIVGKIGFDLSDRAVKRAGLDFWHLVDIEMIPELDVFLDQLDPTTCHFLSSKATKVYTEVRFQPGDRLVFGNEDTGLPTVIHERFLSRFCTIPMLNRDQGMRCLNLSNSAAITLYEAIRQSGF